jgi:hypothetical protein
MEANQRALEAIVEQKTEANPAEDESRLQPFG